MKWDFVKLIKGIIIKPMERIKLKKNEGIAGLLIIVIISMFLLSVGILLAIQGNVSIFSGQFESQADRAQFLAESGIQDAIIKLARNKNYTGSYTITETDGTVDVNVAAGTPIVVRATSTVSRAFSNVKRAMKAEVTLDADGKITNITKANQ